MKICNATGCGVCVSCNGIPPKSDIYDFGDICGKKSEKILSYLKDGNLYRFENGKLYRVEIEYDGATTQLECDI